MEVRRPTDSLVIMNELVLPNDTNTMNNLMGGKLLMWMDICAAMSAQKHARTVCVTAGVNNVSFNHPIRLGNVVTLQARCVRAFNTSVEVHIEVWTQDLTTDEKVRCNEAFYTFVALDKKGNPLKVPHIEPLTEEEKELYSDSLFRRQLKLLVSGRITMKEAPELKHQMQKWIDTDITQIPG